MKRLLSSIEGIFSMVLLIFIIIILSAYYIQNMNNVDNSISEIFTMLAAIAALITALINTLMYRSQRQEFKHSNRPFIMPIFEDSFKYSYKVHPEKQEVHLVNWEKSNEFEVQNLRDSLMDNPQISIVNLGRGPATNIKVNYKITNYGEVLEALSKAEDPKNSLIRTDKDEYNFSVYNDEFTPQVKSLIIEHFYDKEFRSKSVFQIDDFLPQKWSALIEGGSYDFKVRMPSSYIALYNLCAYLQTLNADPAKRVIPILKLSIQCRDNFDEKHNFDYDIHYHDIKVNKDFGSGLINYKWKLKASNSSN